MISHHSLDAPDNEELKNIEQVADHSDASTVYRQAKEQWSGEILSSEERERRRQHTEDTLTFGIRKQFLQIGILAPMPFIFLALLISTNLAIIGRVDMVILAVPLVLSYIIWLVVSFSIMKNLFRIFYKNALTAGPFLFILYAILFLSIQAIKISSSPIHNYQLFTSVAIVSAVEIVLSIVLSYFLLLIWTTPKISGGIKVIFIITLTVLIGFVSLLLTLQY